MSHTDRLKRCPATFRRLTGITPAAFDRLLAELTPRYEHAEARRRDRPGRRRKPGGGRNHSLWLADRLLMLLIYDRTYVTHAFLGFLLGVDDSAVGRDINPFQPLPAGIFRFPDRRADLAEDEIRELFFDATERPTRRPGLGQRAFDSGKKERHTIQAQVVAVRKRKPPGPGAKPRRVRIAAVSPSFLGRTHDKQVDDATRVVGPADAKRTGDTAYVGTGLETPTKRPRRGESTGGRRPGTAGCRGGESRPSTGSARGRRGGSPRSGTATRSAGRR